MKKRRALIALAVCAVLLFTLGCAARSETASGADNSKSAEAAYDTAYAPQMEAAMPAPESDSGSTQTTGEPTGDFDVRKIVYSADMTVTADDPAAALATLVAKAESLGGYVSGSYATTDEVGTTYTTATLKVPADQLEALVTAANALGKLNDNRLSSDDNSLS